MPNTSSPTPTAATDESLVARFRAGDARAFTQIHARYHRPLLEFARSRLGGRGSEADDVVQDALVRAYRALLRSEEPVELRPWLYRIVQNRAIDELRRPARSVPLDCGHPPARLGLVPSPLDGMSAREELAAVVADVVALPPRQREALVAQAVDGVPHQVLATRLGTTVAASKALVNRARGTLLEARAEREGALAAA